LNSELPSFLLATKSKPPGYREQIILHPVGKIAEKEHKKNALLQTVF